jgi:hypothetical protein
LKLLVGSKTRGELLNSLHVVSLFFAYWNYARAGFFGVFTVPKVCSSYSTQLTAYGKSLNYYLTRSLHTCTGHSLPYLGWPCRVVVTGRSSFLSCNGSIDWCCLLHWRISRKEMKSVLESISDHLHHNIIVLDANLASHKVQRRLKCRAILIISSPLSCRAIREHGSSVITYVFLFDSMRLS